GERYWQCPAKFLTGSRFGWTVDQQREHLARLVELGFVIQDRAGWRRRRHLRFNWDKINAAEAALAGGGENSDVQSREKSRDKSREKSRDYRRGKKTASHRRETNPKGDCVEEDAASSATPLSGCASSVDETNANGRAGGSARADYASNDGHT